MPVLFSDKHRFVLTNGGGPTRIWHLTWRGTHGVCQLNNMRNLPSVWTRMQGQLSWNRVNAYCYMEQVLRPYVVPLMLDTETSHSMKQQQTSRLYSTFIQVEHNINMMPTFKWVWIPKNIFEMSSTERWSNSHIIPDHPAGLGPGPLWLHQPYVALNELQVHSHCIYANGAHTMYWL